MLRVAVEQEGSIVKKLNTSRHAQVVSHRFLWKILISKRCFKSVFEKNRRNCAIVIRHSLTDVKNYTQLTVLRVGVSPIWVNSEQSTLVVQIDADLRLHSKKSFNELSKIYVKKSYFTRSRGFLSWKYDIIQFFFFCFRVCFLTEIKPGSM